MAIHPGVQQFDCRIDQPDFQIAICGAGPVGLTLALLLRRQGVAAADIVLLDAKSAAAAEQDARTIALSYGSTQILHSAGCWPIPATAITEIHVSRRGHFGRCLIRSDEYQLPALGYVARYGAIVAPLQAAVAAAGIRVQRPQRVTAVQEHAGHVQLTLDNGANISTALLVQAEGGTFADQTQRQQHRAYGQTALIAHVRCSAPQAGRAFERFTGQGPLALLPQRDAQGDGYALVWCVAPQQAERLLALDDAAFSAVLQNAFGQRLGALRSCSARHAYPLGLNAQAHASARTVSIGNAAQTLHPVAGQGLNLGLRDAAVLAQMLAQKPAAATLAGFVQARAADRHSTIRLTDGLARIFADNADSSISQGLLGLGLGALDVFRPLRDVLARQMMFGWR